MELKLDNQLPYALALEGGGAKGAYQIGAWRALREAGVRVGAVAGTSVGAMNGALIAMGDLDKAEEIWKNIHFSQVMDVDDEAMRRLIHGDLGALDFRTASQQLRAVLRNRGFDVTPLYEWMKAVVNEDAVRASAMELYIVTFSLSDQKEMELRAKDLPEGTICDMLLASAYLPVFRNEKLGGKRYADGGFRDVLPLHVLIENGYKDIIALRLFGVGVERRTRIPPDVHVRVVQPTIDLGGTLNFEPEQSSLDMVAGYYDTQRLLYGLKGRTWYFDAQLSEEEAYDVLLPPLREYLRREGRGETLRRTHEVVLPQLARRLDAGEGDYSDLLLAWLEALAEEAGLDRWHVYTEREMLEKLSPDGRLGCPEKVKQALSRRAFLPF